MDVVASVGCFVAMGRVRSLTVPTDLRFVVDGDVMRLVVVSSVVVVGVITATYQNDDNDDENKIFLA